MVEELNFECYGMCFTQFSLYMVYYERYMLLQADTPQNTNPYLAAYMYYITTHIYIT